MRAWILLAVSILAVAVAHGSPAVDIQALQEQIAGAEARAEGAVAVRSLALETGMATLHLEDGTLFPATVVEGRPVEMVFLGTGRLTATPPDEVEAGQLDLFIGERRLDATFQEAVLVVPRDAAAETLFQGRDPVRVDAAAAQRAAELFRTWRDGAERRQFRVQSSLLRDAAGDATMERFFAAWFRSEDLGDFLYLVDPESFEQVTLGQWVPLDATKREEKRIRRALHSQQRRGRLIGVELDDLGAWDTWMSTFLLGGDGQPAPGQATFQAVHYEIDLAVARVRRATTGNTRLRLRAVDRPGRSMELYLSHDFQVTRVSDAGGDDLPFQREGEGIVILLPEPVAPGSDVTVQVEYEGNPLEKAGFRTFALRDTGGWYPGTGFDDRATFDVTLHYPKRFDLLASGREVDSGDDDEQGIRWVRRELSTPSPAFSFELGAFVTREDRAGHVDITLAYDRESKQLPDEIQEEIQDTIRESLLYYEEIFGPYPLDHLTVVTSPRPFSQGFFGFITLSDLMISDLSGLRWLFRMEDRRTIIAHEVAHQWWGNIVGWRSYRDQWLSEAMANYASLLYGRHRLDGKMRRGPTAGWRRQLLTTTDDGRTVESLGPLVLGARLDSARYGAAYFPIVYTKGAMILDTLSRFFREDQFVDMLGHLSRAAVNHDISTEDFIGAIERMSGVELDWFRKRYIYDTGFPEVDYTYEFQPREGGGWHVTGSARQRPTYHHEYRAVRLPTGGHDVVRERTDHLDVARSNVVVPFQLIVEKPAEDEGDPVQSEVYGRMLLTGEETPFQVDVDDEPKRFWLDRRGEALATFFCESREPKRVIFYQALDLAAAGRFDEAEAAFRRALEAPVRSAPDPDRQTSEESMASEAGELDGLIRLHMVRMFLDQGLDDRAQEEFDFGQEMMTKDDRHSHGPLLRYLASRLEVRRGEYEAAFKRLRRPVLVNRTDRSTESLVLLSIAARETDHPRELKKALERAESRGADLSILTESG